MTKIGLILPTKLERPEKFQVALESALGQTIPVKVTVVCPASGYELAQKITQNAGPTSEIEILTDPGEGLSAALNLGLKHQSQAIEYVGWLGDDDYLYPWHFEHLALALEENTRATVAVASCEYVNGSGTRFRIQSLKFATFNALSVFPNQIPQPSTLMRMSAVVDAGYVDETLALAMDLDLWFRLLKVGHFIRVSGVTAKYMWHSESLSGMNQRRALRESIRVRRRYCPWHLRPFQEFVDSLASFATLLFQSKLDAESSRQTKDNR